MNCFFFNIFSEIDIFAKNVAKHTSHSAAGVDEQGLVYIQCKDWYMYVSMQFRHCKKRNIIFYHYLTYVIQRKVN